MTQKEETSAARRLTHEAQVLTHEAQVLTREVVSAAFRLRTYRLIRKILIGFILVSIANVLFSYFFYTPKIYRINRDNRELIIRYRILQERIRTAQRRVDAVRHRDNYVYRPLFSTDTLSLPGIWQPYPASKYAPLEEDEFAPLMISTWRQLDALARTLYLESVSMDELQTLSQDKEQLAAAVPAIWPIDAGKIRFPAPKNIPNSMLATASSCRIVSFFMFHRLVPFFVGYKESIPHSSPLGKCPEKQKSAPPRKRREAAGSGPYFSSFHWLLMNRPVMTGTSAEPMRDITMAGAAPSSPMFWVTPTTKEPTAHTHITM